jgi:hypothetical protein
VRKITCNVKPVDKPVENAPADFILKDQAVLKLA